jgi:cell wall-associated NlpC family hydrolase
MTFCKSLCVFVFLLFITVNGAYSQQRERVVPTEPTESQTANQTANQTTPTANIPPPAQKQIPTLTNNIQVVNPNPQTASLIKKTGSSQPLNAPVNATVSKNMYNMAFSQRLMSAIQTRIGTPYRLGSTGPHSYDCSGLVWSVFNEAGFYFERSSARNLWQNSVPVEGDDKFKFGTLVFFNSLGHIGIVVDDKGFYHASSSKGVMYSSFDGYWGKRIVGFRQLQMPAPTAALSNY